MTVLALMKVLEDEDFRLTHVGSKPQKLGSGDSSWTARIEYEAVFNPKGKAFAFEGSGFDLVTAINSALRAARASRQAAKLSQEKT